MTGIRMTPGTKGFGVAIGCLALALMVTACAGSKSKTASASSSAPAVSPSVSAAPSSAPASGGARNTAAFAAYTACLTQHGVTVPSFSRGPRPSGSFSRPPGSFSRPPGASRGPGGGGFGGFGGSADPSTAAARAACASLLPAGAFGGGGGRTISATTFAAFKSCMSDNGVTITVTDPTQAIRSLNRSDAKTAAALKICQPILGTQGTQGSGAPSPTPAASS
ncbi:MAG TPA: hypothetical protein VGD55_08680 [Acidothermaceae bacterium]